MATTNLTTRTGTSVDPGHGLHRGSKTTPFLSAASAVPGGRRWRALTRCLVALTCLTLSTIAYAEILYVSNTETGEIIAIDLSTNVATVILTGLTGLADGAASPTSGKIYFAANGGIVRFDPDGTELEQVLAPGLSPWGLAFDAAGDLYFTPRTSPWRVYRMAAGTPNAVPEPVTGQMTHIGAGITIDLANNLWAVDQRPTASGGTVCNFGTSRDPANTTCVAANNAQVAVGVAHDSQGNIYFSDAYQDYIHRRAPNGTLYPGGWVDLRGPNYSPLLMETDSQDNLYVTTRFPSNTTLVLKVAPNRTWSVLYAGTPGTDANSSLLGLAVFSGQLPQAVDVDIEPDRPKNKVKRRAIAVGVLSSPTFSPVVEVDQTTLTFGLNGTENSLYRCWAGSRGGRDYNGDGTEDLYCSFFTLATGLDPNVHLRGDVLTLRLRGTTFGGAPIKGDDTVVIVRLR